MTGVRVAPFPPRIQEDRNPYARLLYGELAGRGFATVTGARFTLGWLRGARRDVDVLHFHWDPQERYVMRPRGRVARALHRLRMERVQAGWDLGAFVGRLVAARWMGYRVAWTIHEVVPHESPHPRCDRLASMALARLSHVLLTHDRATADRAKSELRCPAADIHVVPHGSYVGVYPGGRPREIVRADLGMPADAFVFLAFGHLRPCKQIETLLDAFHSLPSDRARLVVAGVAWTPAIRDALTAAAERDARIRPVLGFVDEARVSELYRACDAAILARGDGWTSGSLILALSQGLPAVAARTAAYTDLLEDEAGGWLFEPGSVDSLRSALAAAAADPAGARRKGAAALARAQRLSWSETAALTAHLLQPVGNGSA